MQIVLHHFHLKPKQYIQCLPTFNNEYECIHTYDMNGICVDCLHYDLKQTTDFFLSNRSNKYSSDI